MPSAESAISVGGSLIRKMSVPIRRGDFVLVQIGTRRISKAHLNSREMGHAIRFFTRRESGAVWALASQSFILDFYPTAYTYHL